MTLVLGRWRRTPEIRHTGTIFGWAAAASVVANFLLWSPVIFDISEFEWAEPAVSLFSLTIPLVAIVAGLAGLLVPVERARKCGFAVLVGAIGWFVGGLLVVIIGGLIRAIGK
jgi:hypothetical protein